MRSTRLTLAALALALSTGCGSGPTPIPEPDWAALGPVIDVHCHVFSGRDVPIAEWLVSVYDLPRWLAGAVELLVDERSVNPPPRHEAKLAVAPELRGLVQLFRAAVADPLRPTRAELAALEAILAAAAPFQEKLAAFVQSDGGRIGAAPAAIKNTLEWALVLTREREELWDRLAKTFPGTALFTPSIVDMNFWFGGKTAPAQGSVPWSIAEQIAVMGKLASASNGRLLPFLAFDPERESRAGLAPGAVKARLLAATAAGFIGVKVYPPFGYRPWNDGGLFPGHECGVAITGAQRTAHERAMIELFGACAALDLPVQAHCEDPGAGAARCGEHTDPKHWEEVLARHPNLRLDLMHLGGVEALVREDYAGSWAWRIGNLMKRYPRLYADVGAHDVPITAKESLRKGFFERLDRMNASIDPAVRDRIMFGTDWHLIVRHDEHALFAKHYLGAWQARFGPESAKRFARGAALDYLGFRGGDNLTRVRRFFESNGWTWPPAWLR